MAKKEAQAEQFLELLSETPIVSAVCERLNLSRQSVYRWCREDRNFKREFDECVARGRDNINDLAESKLIKALDKGEPWAIKFWLMNNKTNYTSHKSGDFRRIIGSELVRYRDLAEVELGYIPCE